MGAAQRDGARVARRLVLTERAHGAAGFALTLDGEDVPRVRAVTISSRIGEATRATIEVLPDGVMVDVDAVVTKTLVALTPAEQKVINEWRKHRTKDTEETPSE